MSCFSQGFVRSLEQDGMDGVEHHAVSAAVVRSLYHANEVTANADHGVLHERVGEVGANALAEHLHVPLHETLELAGAWSMHNNSCTKTKFNKQNHRHT